MPCPLRSRAHALVVLALFLNTALLDAQCPDGTPPPCRSVIVQGAPRRTNPPLDRRAWIVVPFTNVMKSQELDWLRDASVNLLTLDLGRWTDVHVVPDKRVGDLVRELPTGRDAALTLFATFFAPSLVLRRIASCVTSVPSTRT